MHRVRVVVLFFSAILVWALAWPAWAENAPLPIYLEEMTWPEVRDALKAGRNTAIVPTGGTEQTGPHLVTGKHNFILRYTALATAQRLGNALVTPILGYVPEGAISPPTGHMRFPGTLSLRPDTFAAVLEDTARSLKQHGFTLICFLGEHGGSQSVQAEVAQRLSQEWRGEGVRVLHVSDYYDPSRNGQLGWFKKNGVEDPDPEAHGGLADTSEMMAAYPQGVRDKLRGAHAAADYAAIGAGGSSDHASRPVGALLLELKVQSAVRQIRAAQSAR